MPLNQTTFSTMIKERKSAKNERPGMLSIMPKIPEISIASQVEGPVSVLFDRNIRDPLWGWSTGFDWSDRSDLNLPFHAVFGKPVHCPSSLHLCREFGKRKKKWVEPFLLVIPLPRVFPLVQLCEPIPRPSPNYVTTPTSFLASTARICENLH